MVRGAGCLRDGDRHANPNAPAWCFRIRRSHIVSTVHLLTESAIINLIDDHSGPGVAGTRDCG